MHFLHILIAKHIVKVRVKGKLQEIEVNSIIDYSPGNCNIMFYGILPAIMSGVLETTKRNEEVWGNYEFWLQNLRPLDRTAVLYHDVSGILTNSLVPWFALKYLKISCDIGSDSPSFNGSGELLDLKNMDQYFDAIQKAHDLFDRQAFIDSQPENYHIRGNDQLPDIVSLRDVFRDSIAYLHGVASKKAIADRVVLLEKLKNDRVGMSTLASLFNVDISELTIPSVNGIEGTILINLLSNAVKYGTFPGENDEPVSMGHHDSYASSLKYSLDDSTYCVINHSNRLPFNPKDFKKDPSKSGLGIAGYYAHKLGRDLQFTHEEVMVDPKYGPLYKITATF